LETEELAVGIMGKRKNWDLPALIKSLHMNILFGWRIQFEITLFENIKLSS
jgi:hypothetical protein